MTAITVLGQVGVEGEPALPPRDRVVLAVLVARRGQEVAADTLADALWGEALPASWAKVVQGCVARLRRRLGSGAILTGTHGYRLVVPADDIDAGRFERLVDRARHQLDVGHADQAAYAASQALDLWGGEPLAELADWDSARGESERLTELRLLAEELRLAALLASGHHGEVLPEAAALVRSQPLREHRWALLARAQYQQGQQAEALSTLRRAREVLAEELGLDPGPELVELERSVLQQDPDLAVPVAAVAAAACPWPGLASYDVEDADTFFGRRAELEECLVRLARTGFLAVVGPSGSGKSSLARAGIAARLQQGGRTVEVITPDPDPLGALRGLSGHGPAPVLVVDQSEEIFAPSVPPAVRATFLEGIVAHTARAPVVLTLRADRLGQLTAYPAVARLVEEGLYLLKIMDETGLRQAIEQPAHQAGLLLEHGFVDLLVRDVEGEPGSLPLLAHALRETWKRREGSTLTVAGYQASGGIRGAVAQSAEKVYEEATPDQREALRELLLRMVQPGPGGDPVRTSVSRDVLVADPQHGVLVEQLVRARLLIVEADRLEIAHEALARAWPRLQAWLADDVEGERIRHHLAATALGWDALGRPDSELYRGARLSAAREWRDSGSHRLSTVEQEFLAASEAAHQSRLARAEGEARRQRKVNRRLRLLVVGVTLLALVAATFGGLARQQWQRSQLAQDALSEAADEARSQELAASAVAAVGEDPALAKALAVLGAQAAPPSFQSQDALHRAIVADRVVSRISMNHYTERLWAVLHPDGDRVAMAAESGFTPGLAVEVHDARSGDLLWEWVRPDEPGYESAVMAGAQYSPDGSLLASGVVWHPESNVRFGPPLASAPPPAPGLLGVHLWDGRTHEPLGVLDVGPCGGWPLAMGGDHLLVRTLVAPPSKELSDAEEADLLEDCRWGDGAMGTLVVDRTTGESQLVTVVEALNLDLTVGHALSHDGSLAMVPDFANGYGLMVDTSTGREIDRLETLFGFDFDAAGERLLVLDRSDTFRYIWRVLSVPELDTLTSFAGHEGASFYGRFGPGDASVFTTGLDNVTHQWDAATGERLLTIPAGGAGPATTSEDLVLIPRPDTPGAVLVDASPPGELWSLPSCQGPGGTADRLRVAGDIVVVGRECDGQEVGRLETVTRSGTPVQSWAGVSWEAFAVSPDGRRVVARHGAGTTQDGVPLLGPMRVLDLGTGEVEITLQGFCDHTLPDLYNGIAADDPALKTCGRVGDPSFTFGTLAVRWSPNGRWIVAVDGEGGGVVVWDARTGDVVEPLLTPGDVGGQGVWARPYDAVFSPSSDQLVVSTMTGRLVVIDTATWEVGPDRQLEVLNRSSAGMIGYADDGSLVVVVPLRQNAANTRIMLLDPQTLAIRGVLSDVAEGTVQSAHLSPDGTRVALATTEGVVSVWDLSKELMLDQADLGLGRLDGVQWLDDQDLVVLSSTGHLTTVTTDAQRLLSLARDSLTRGLTESECRSYEVGPCPSLATLQGSEPVVPEEIRGSYTLTWEDDELTEAAVTWAEDAFIELDSDSLEALLAQAQLMAGSYRLELGASDYSITRGDAGAVWCTGSVTTAGDRPDRLLLGADSGDRCLDFHYVEVGWELEGDQLSFPRDEFRGSYFDRILWTSKPLQKVENSAGR